MKQHVTPKQLSEISIEKCCTIFETYEGRKDFYKYNAKKMTIGKMIELLDTNATDVVVCHEETDSLHNTYVWYVSFCQGMGGPEFFNKELCDALWEAVKEVISDTKEVN
jgi:hypothetical protein